MTTHTGFIWVTMSIILVWRVGGNPSCIWMWSRCGDWAHSARAVGLESVTSQLQLQLFQTFRTSCRGSSSWFLEYLTTASACVYRHAEKRILLKPYLERIDEIRQCPLGDLVGCSTAYTTQELKRWIWSFFFEFGVSDPSKDFQVRSRDWLGHSRTWKCLLRY